MNYLAHFHLSHGDDDLLVGALLGDFIKGPLTGLFSKNLEQGILLHRKIDAFTDSHLPLRKTQRLFEPQYRRYAGIMTDVVFDHFLNRHWPDLHHQSLPLFSQYVYQLLTDNKQLTAAAKKQADNLIRHDVFDKYQHWRTVDMALTNIGKRIRGTNPLHEAAGEMLQHYPALERQFLDFYPQLQNYVWQIRQEFNSDSKT